jgi:hypothetical protein
MFKSLGKISHTVYSCSVLKLSSKSQNNTNLSPFKSLLPHLDQFLKLSDSYIFHNP